MIQFWAPVPSVPVRSAGSRPQPAIGPCRAGTLSRGKVGERLSDWAISAAVTESAKQIGIGRFGAHDLQRTCAKLCRKAGGYLEQIKFLLGHSSIQMTELPGVRAGHRCCRE
jgi:integrase